MLICQMWPQVMEAFLILLYFLKILHIFNWLPFISELLYLNQTFIDCVSINIFLQDKSSAFYLHVVIRHFMLFIKSRSIQILLCVNPLKTTKKRNNLIQKTPKKCWNKILIILKKCFKNRAIVNLSNNNFHNNRKMYPKINKYINLCTKMANGIRIIKILPSFHLTSSL